MTLHPSQFEYHSRVQFQSGVASWLMVLTGWGLLTLACFLRQPALKAASFGGVLLVGCAARPVRRIAIATERLSNDVADLSHTSNQRWLFKEMEPTAGAIVQRDPVKVGEATLEVEPDTYDIRTILDEATGIALLGNSGSGKSCVAQWLISLMGPSQIMVLDPHDDGQTWGKLPVVASYENIVRQLELLLEELDARREKRRKGIKFDPIAVVCDEWPSIRLYCEQVKSDVADRFLLRMGSEARKFSMLCLFCSQSGNVEALGLKGKGDFLQNFTLIRLGIVARKYAKNLSDRTVLQRLNQVAYGCMVDDTVAVHPTHGHHTRVYKGATPANLQPLQSLPLRVETVLPIPYLMPSSAPTTTGAIPAYSPSNVVHFSPRNRETTSRNGAETRQKQQLRPTYPDTEMISDSAPTTPISDHDRAKRVREMKAAGLSQTQILRIEWGVSPGSSPRYTQAVLEYRAIVGDATE